jgi:PAS domain S-box-containing protein
MKAKARWSRKKRKVPAGHHQVQKKVARERSFPIEVAKAQVKRAGAEEAVHAEEERFRVVLDSLSEPLADIAPDQRYRFANAAFEQWYGLTSEQVKGRSVREVVREEIYGTIQPFIKKALLGQRASFEGYLPYDKAGRRYVHIDFVPRRDEGREAYGFYSVLKDLTGVKDAEEKFRGVAEAVADAIVLANREGRIVMTNPQAESMFGYAQQELIGQPVEILMPDRFRKGHLDHRSAYSQKPVARPMGKGLELTAVRKDGSELPVEIRLTPIETAKGTIVATTIRDITERKLLVQQARWASVLEERSRMARDVHDTLAQAFTGIVLNLEAAEEEAQDLSEEVRRRIGTARDVARQSLEEVRRSILALSSALPVQGDLANSIREFVARSSSSTKTRVEFSVQGTLRHLDSALEENLLRIAQQATDNALQHARASSVRIELAFDETMVQLTITDDGQGFDVKKAGRGSGLSGMRERAKEIGGKFELKSQPGKGTRVAVKIPRPPTASQ